jgi:ATP synthase protein I
LQYFEILCIFILCILWTYALTYYNLKWLIGLGVFGLKKKNNKNMYKNLALITQIGLSIITPILLGVYLGGLLDKKLKTEMIFTLTFIVIGAGAGFLNLFKFIDKK